ncbi:glycosyltransferase involved in cell wall biosynthesis [Sagittula marina]|uniref:Glycosyltransferase involved in cell wall biosynthesis n=1 Tax=Sagittula marina TaxID=943940 RepID=A0A7W6DM64_9RHOB|nr:glycosyltransferase family 1 protein [Sagittula marina]MBB3983981.1 glycosyltransferase involved in cell wall biosynthesis [Sagittula marina]
MTRLLDLSRLVSRAGRPLTGVDRVEFAWLDHLLTLDAPLYGLVRSAFGYMLLDRHGCAVLRERILHGGWAAPDILSRLKRNMDPLRAGAEAELRQRALDRCLPPGLPRMLRNHLPKGVRYINLGHTNFTRRLIHALTSLDAQKAVLIHDTIPLDHPEYQRPGTVETFRSFLQRVGRHADLILCNSIQTETDLHRHLHHVPSTLVTPLGVDLAALGTAPDGPWRVPYFVTLGTIEPRKNHALLLDVWEKGVDADLLILGHRGWENHATFARLDARPHRVHELSGLTDPQVTALIAGAAGFLFPSLAEGYGLPPMEAAGLGVPVLCHNLPIYEETLRNIPVYADAGSIYLWHDTIQKMADDYRANRKQCLKYSPPTWAAHFKTALTRI